MGIDIKKSGNNTYYRKDGNKMGGRKESMLVILEIINNKIKIEEEKSNVE